MNDNSYNSKDTPAIWIIAQAAAIWIISDIGYYTFLPILGIGGYTANPIKISIYYLFWIVLALFSFWNIYKEWNFIQNKTQAIFSVIIFSISIILYFLFIFPLFPGVKIPGWQSPTELLVATPWYFLPKSMDIILQQLLITAIILRLHFQGFNFKTVALWCAIFFGSAHLLLVFGGGGALYTFTFTLSAVVASFIFSYFILKVKDGFLYSYFIHWIFYAITLVIARILFI